MAKAPFHPKALRRELETFVRSCRREFPDYADLYFHVTDKVWNALGLGYASGLGSGVRYGSGANDTIEVDGSVAQMRKHMSYERGSCQCDVVVDGRIVNKEFCMLRGYPDGLDAMAEAVSG